MFLEYFNFHNYSPSELDWLYYIEDYFLFLVLTYFAWKLNLEYDKPVLIKLLMLLIIVLIVLWDTLIISYPRITFKLLYALISCSFLKFVLNKIYNL